jgi:hypothetical protein
MTDSDDEIFREIGKNNEKNNNNYIGILKHKYKDYELLSINNIEKLKSGDYIYFVNNLGFLVYAGIYIKLINYYYKIRNALLASLSEETITNEKNIYLLLKLDNTWYKFKFFGNIIFFKHKKNKSDVLRDILVKKI